MILLNNGLGESPRGQPNPNNTDREAGLGRGRQAAPLPQVPVLVPQPEKRSIYRRKIVPATISVGKCLISTMRPRQLSQPSETQAGKVE